MTSKTSSPCSYHTNLQSFNLNQLPASTCNSKVMYFQYLAFVAPLLLCPASIVSAQGSIQLFSDSNCQNPTGIPISLLSEKCLGTNDTTAISAVSLPTCDNGNPKLVISDLDGCQRPSISPEVSSGDVGVCLFFLTGSGIGSAAFTCVRTMTTISNNPSPETTSSKTTSVSQSRTSPASSTATLEPPSSLQGNQHSSDIGLSNRIALGCGIGVGLAAIIVAIVFGIPQLQHLRAQRRHNQVIASNGSPPSYESDHEMQPLPPPAY
jgi:hypothetical protein